MSKTINKERRQGKGKHFVPGLHGFGSFIQCLTKFQCSMKKLFLLTAFSVLCCGSVFAQTTWVAFTSPSPQAADISLIESDNVLVEFSVDVFGMYKKDTTVSNMSFQRINTPGGTVTVSVGEPEMPYIRQLIAIPHCDDVSLTVNVTGSTSFTNYNIYPAPELVEVIHPDSSVSLEESFVYDSIAYQKNQNYPQVTAEIVSTGYLRDQMYAEVFIYPVQFNPVSGNLQVNTSYALTLSFTNPSGPVNENVGIFNNVATNVFLNYVSSGITAKINDRPGHTGSIEWIELTQQSQASEIVADYLIITDSIFWDPSGQITDLLKIVQHRAEYNGFDIAIVKVEQVMDIFNTPGEDYEYERAIRRFIKAVFDNDNANNTYDGKLGYVLLVGGAIHQGSDHWVPPSYENIDPEIFSDFGPNDYYYSCITQNLALDYDVFGDLFIGRISVYNNDELANNAEKILYFEKEADFGNWRKNAGFTRLEDSEYVDNINTMYQILDNYINPPYSMKLFDTDSLPLGGKTEPFINEFNEGRLAMFYFGHSNINEYPYDAQYPSHCTDAYMMNNLQNCKKNPFVLNFSCLSGNFIGQNPCLMENLINTSNESGYLCGMAAPVPIGISYLRNNVPNNPPHHIIEGRIPYSIWNNLSHITGEFILESKCYTSRRLERFKLNYFGDPALNLMAEGFKITGDFSFECGTEISSEIFVREGATLTIPGCSLSFVDNGKLIIDHGATLKIYSFAVISGINPQNAIEVYGNIEFIHENQGDIEFTAPDGHSWHGLIISNHSIDLDVSALLTFKNCNFICRSESLNLAPYAGLNQFNNSYFEFSHGSLVLSNANFTNSSILVLSPDNHESSVEISNCEFNNEFNVFLSTIFIERYMQYDIHENDIYFSDGDGITIFNCGGITDYNYPNGITNNVIEYTGSSPDLHKGIKVYRSVADISLNEIINADYGIVGMNNSSITITGDESATTYDETQQIVNNDSYQMHFTNNSFPEEIKFNIIGNGDNPAPLIFTNCKPPAGNKLDVTLNCWDAHFSPGDDLLPANAYEWTPDWCPATTASSTTNSGDIVLYESAMQKIESGDYIGAETDLREIISDYPETGTAVNALKQLYELEGVATQDYQALKTYYQSEPNLQNNNNLGKLAAWMVSYCDVKLEAYQDAIDWYDNVIDTTSSEEDSTFAAIDMGDAYLTMGGGMKSTVSCKHSQFLFDSQKAFEINREYLINELLKSQKAGEQDNSDLPGEDENQLAVLHQNVPNPFNSTTTIKVELHKACNIELDVLDMHGKKVLTLAKAYFEKDIHTFVVSLNEFTKGMYFYSLKVNDVIIDTKKMIIQ
jgi:tetratricopeptide (TPR) repeat protein